MPAWHSPGTYAVPLPATPDIRADEGRKLGYLPLLMMIEVVVCAATRPVTTLKVVVTGRPPVRPRVGCVTAADRLAASRAHRSAALRAAPSSTAMDAPGRVHTWAFGASPGHQRQRDKTPSRTRRSAASGRPCSALYGAMWERVRCAWQENKKLSAGAARCAISLHVSAQPPHPH